VTDQHTAPEGPDLSLGISEGSLADGGMLAGRVGDDAVLLARVGNEFFAVGASCTHYNGPLAEGLLVGDTVRCPWHHACFSLRTGAAIRPPALNDLRRWRVEVRNGLVLVREQLPQDQPVPFSRGRSQGSMVIVGAGAAGATAAETLRREGFEGRLILVDPDTDVPYDRPNLSKDYLAGTIPDDYLPLHPRSYYAEQHIDLLAGRTAKTIDVRGKRILLDDGTLVPFDRLLIATGAAPVVLDLPVSNGQQVHYLRTLQDSLRIIRSAEAARRAVVLGTSFIGLEVAASLRTRGLEVHVVGPDALPLGKILGPELGQFIRDLHQENGVVFHLGHTAREWTARGVILDDETTLPADVVVAGVGVQPNLRLAVEAGLAVDGGILVDERLETSAPGVFAAGDVARWIEPRTGDRVRIEHWVVAERMGQTVARNMLGQNLPFDAVPFFWSQHYDVPINYVGHGGTWDRAVVDGDPAARDCAVTYYRNGRAVAMATIYRDQQSLTKELEMEGGLVNQEG
jgi:NADPH-dependent 2,4-dienoyl-CoA reductase/sulfur reductase-like enzyme/nitrite reductase/ring-hydroxylating ferredoxin subunit